MSLPEGAIVRAATRPGGHGENFRGLEYEMDERMAILQDGNPDMCWNHARNKAKKELTERKIYELAKKQGSTQ